MSDDSLISAIGTFLSGSWRFFTQVDVPGTGFSFAVLLVGLAIVPISLSFLSLVLGFSVGTLSDAESIAGRLHLPATYTSVGSSRYRISPGRQLDVR